MDITKLKNHIPDIVYNQLQDTIIKFEINTPARLAHFLSQTSHESGNYSVVQENLNYSATTLRKLFPNRVTTDAMAKSIEHNQEKVGNAIYSNRLGNGDAASGEGFKYRGRGYIQLTGKDNYKAFSNDIGEDCVANPDLVATKYPLASAAWFWKKNSINNVADLGTSLDVITKVTKKINGGTIGLDERVKKFNSFYQLLTT